MSTHEGSWWSAHTHSRKSKHDALTGVGDLVDQAVVLGYPALALTDHGDVGGTVELYQRCRKAGIAPLPGEEIYLTPDAGLGLASSMHLTVMAYTGEGYRNLVGLHNQAQKQFHYRPRLDFGDLADLAERGKLQGLAIGTGCRSGPVVKALVDRGEDAALQVAEALAGWFPRTYIELMDHHFKADGMWDTEITDALLNVAMRAGLPYIVTTDSHYALESDRDAHNALKQLTGWSSDPEDSEFNGSGYWLRSQAEMEAEWGIVLDGALDSLRDLAEAAKVAIPELDTFTLKVPDRTMNGTQQQELEQRSHQRLAWFMQDKGWSEKKRKTYIDRMHAELDTVRQSGFAGYLLLVMWITDMCWERGVWFHTRGSATGSLILFVNKVTQRDPVDRNIRFDRFLSPDRASPPDVDLDIEHTRRDEIMDEVRVKYPVLQVGTTMTYSLRQEEGEEFEEGGEQQGGSLLVKYYSVRRKQAEAKGEPLGNLTWADVPAEDKKLLYSLADRNLVSGRGSHPGGYIIAATEESVAAMPLTAIGSDHHLVTAYDKGEVEAMGFPKIDLLGSKVLTALHISCDLVTGTEDSRQWYDDLDLNDKDALKRINSGNTAGLFQMQGWTNRQVAMEMAAKKLDDLVAIQALARPAPMKSGFTKSYFKRRKREEAVPLMHDDILAETKATYGLAIYQEQLVGVLRRLGLDALRLTKLLKAVKASGKAHALEAAKVMAAELEPLKALARSRGWSDADIAWLEGCLHDYGAGYSFGQAHAEQYAVVAARTAWLAAHEPLAFWTGMLVAYTGAKNARKEDLELLYKRAARNDGVRVIGPHAHYSGIGYTPDPKAFAIREGLVSIGGVGLPCATELIDKRPYKSLVDLGQRVLPSKVSGVKELIYGKPPHECTGQVKALWEANALKGIEPGVPVRKAKGRIRRCQQCKVTFGTPLEYEDHVDAEHA